MEAEYKEIDLDGFYLVDGVLIDAMEFERDYEPVPSEDVVAGIVDEALGRMLPEQADEAIDKIKAIRDQVRARNLASLKLADELAAILEKRRHTLFDDEALALSAYLESRKGR